MARYVSFRFDDGFIEGARKAVACLAPDCGTFFLVSDLVRNGAVEHPEPLFRNRDFGSVAEWQALAQSGQDIQSHGKSHRDLQLLSPDERRLEISASLACTKELHDGPYIFCQPYNRLVDFDFRRLGFSAAGFRTATSDHDILYHRLDCVDPFGLRSWAVRERHFDKVVQALTGLPDESWAILAFHSLDGEGHEPWSVDGLRSLVASCRDLDLTVATISEMIQRIAPR